MNLKNTIVFVIAVVDFMYENELITLEWCTCRRERIVQRMVHGRKKKVPRTR